MTTTCEDNNLNNADGETFSISNYRRDSTHCFYQNRGMNSNDNVQDECEINNHNYIMQFSHITVIQPLLTGEWIFFPYTFFFSFMNELSK